MLITTSSRSVENSSLDMAEDAEVGSGTNSTTISVENLLSSIDMAEDVQVSEGNDSNDKTVEKSPFSKKPHVLIEYFTFLRPRKKMSFS